jgi:hypothetical protein
MEDESGTDEIATWRAERAIGRVIQSYARGVDRQDFGRVRDCFHADARILYGEWFSGDLDEAIEWLEASVPLLDGTLHVFAPSWIELDLASASADCETYAINSALYPPDDEGRVVQNVSGTRYLDRFECRAGKWAIVERRNTRVWTRNDLVEDDPPMPEKNQDLEG